MNDGTPIIVALDHPSIQHAVDRFATELKQEKRYFGPSATPAPFPSLIRELTQPGGLRLGTMVDGRLVAMARVADSGETALAVVDDWRNRGVGRSLLTFTARRAGELGHGRIVLHSSRRSRALASLGSTIGATTVDHGRGRIDLIFATERFAHTA